MNNVAILRNLYELRELTPSVEAINYIDKWIKSVQKSLREESYNTVGLGDIRKTTQALLKSNELWKPELARMMKTSHFHQWILTDEDYFVLRLIIKDVPGYPYTTHKQEYADKEWDFIKDCEKRCKTPVKLPERWELDYVIRDHSAQTVKKRTKVPQYNLGPGCPTVNAKRLSDLLVWNFSHTGYIDETLGEKSPLFIGGITFSGALRPIL